MWLVIIPHKCWSKIVEIIAPTTTFEINRTDTLIVEEVIFPDQIGVNEAKRCWPCIKQTALLIRTFLYVPKERKLLGCEELMAFSRLLKSCPIKQVLSIQ